MIKFIYKNCFAVLKRKPMLLWGLSLLFNLLVVLATILGVLPIISIPIVLVLSAGMRLIYLDGYNNKEVSSNQLFAGFKNFFHVAGGMAWMALWIFLWALIPVVGPVFATIKAYSYRFTPYILMQNPDMTANDALRLSMKKTEGFKGKMFLADLYIGLIIFGVFLVLGLFMLIPVDAIKILFIVIEAIIYIALLIFLPLFTGLVNAAFYEEVPKMPPPTPKGEKQPTITAFCGECGAPLHEGQRFCAGCGKQIG